MSSKLDLSKDRYKKIVAAIKLVCPMFDKDMITEALIVGSVANGTSKIYSDIDIYLINSLFENQVHTHGIEINPDYYNDKDMYINNIVKYLKSLDIEFIYVTCSKYKDMLYHQIYENEEFHLMFDYNIESIKNSGEYIEITKEFCNSLKL